MILILLNIKNLRLTNFLLYLTSSLGIIVTTWLISNGATRITIGQSNLFAGVVNVTLMMTASVLVVMLQKSIFTRIMVQKFSSCARYVRPNFLLKKTDIQPLNFAVLTACIHLFLRKTASTLLCTNV